MEVRGRLSVCGGVLVGYFWRIIGEKCRTIFVRIPRTRNEISYAANVAVLCLPDALARPVGVNALRCTTPVNCSMLLSSALAQHQTAPPETPQTPYLCCIPEYIMVLCSLGSEHNRTYNYKYILAPFDVIVLYS